VKVLVQSPLDQFSGYGRDGIGLVRGLLDLRHDVRVCPTFVRVPLPRDIAGLLTAPLDPPFDVVLHHTPLKESVLLPEEAAGARRSVLWTMWGRPELPDEPWVKELAERIAYFDYVAVYDDQTYTALMDVPGMAADRLVKVLGGYEADDWKLPEEPPKKRSDHFLFGMVGRLPARKGVYRATQAFSQLKERHGDDFHAKLLLHSIESFPPPEASDVHVIVHRSLPEELRDFYWGLDTLLAPSYAEAKHLPPIEALACGTPVILSDIPGHRGWATSDMVTWVPTNSVEDMPTDAVETLADAMWSHYTNIGPQRVKAQTAARTLPAMLDWSKCLRRLGLKTGLLL
jgi:glycosyltransferase involved in cell wall biosynthesis